MCNRSLAPLFFAAAAIAALTTAASAAEPAANYNFNPGWRLLVGDPNGAESPAFDDSAWKPVTLPHPWNEDDAFAKSIHDLRTGVAWYRKHFTLPPDTAGKKVFLEFEGIRHGGEFFVNGKSVGLHENGVMAAGFDVTAALNPAGQDNVIAVRTDSSWKYHEKATHSTYEWADSNFYANYGGINKNVILHVKGGLHQTLPLYSNLGTTGVYVYATDIDVPAATATVHAESQVKNEYPDPKTFTYEVTVDDLDGKLVATFAAAAPVTLAPGQTTTVAASSKLSDLHFWSWGYGYLYTVHTTLKLDGKSIDSVATRTGFRKTAFDHGYLTLNDRPIQVHGYAQRTTNEWPAVGNAVPAWVSDFSNGLIVESGGNLVRWMHVTPWKQDVESCDRVGLMQAMPAGDAEKDVDGRRWQQRVELMRDAIIYNRNNPSIIFYECGNNGISDEHMAEMKKVRDQYDPHGGRAIGSRNMQGSKVAEYGGEMLYINKSAGKPMWAMEYCRDESLRKYWDDLTPPFHKDGAGPDRGKERPYAYNRNQDSYTIEDVVRWYDYWRERPGTGTRVSGGGVNIVFSDTNTHMRGAENYRRSGEVDALRIPKDAFYAHQVMWDGWVDTEHPRVHIAGHWNYDKPVKKDLTVIANTPAVHLTLNGHDLGAPERSAHFLFTFKNVTFQPGTLEATGCDESGKELCTAELKTAGAPAALRLTPHTSPTGLQADGADLALVDVEVVDKEGNRCPTALNPVHFILTGPAEWRGGLAQDDDRPDNYVLSKNLPVQCGVNRVLVRSMPEPGTITLRAESPSLAPATLTLNSVAVPVEHGLSTTFPQDGLRPRLDRGPTPSTPSFAPTRTPLKIASAAAGSNADDAAASYDDNEVTAWSSDGHVGTGWIAYTLAAPARVSEITLKLAGWRTKRYPLRVSVDGQTVYTGTTPPSLGYVTLAFKPTTGKTVRIELAGKSSSSDALDLTEVTGKKNIDAPTRGAAGDLKIVEAELYAPITAASLSSR